MAEENIFPIFLHGSHPVKGTELIQILPQEIRYKIWLEYASSLSYEYIVEKELIEVLELKISRENIMFQNLPTLRSIFFDLPLQKKLSILAKKDEPKIKVLKFLRNKYGKDY